MKPTRAAFLHSPDIEKYHYPPNCPFKTQRAVRTRNTLESMDLLSGRGRREVAPEPARREQLQRFHAARYLDVLQRASLGELEVEGLHMGLGTDDCPVFFGLYEYAALAAGATLAAARLLLEDEVDVAFNPSGGFHHAHAAPAGGFCYINDVVLGCMELADAGRRTLFLDVDLHHCDGVQDAFYDRPDVLTLSLHESGRSQFPGTGFEDEIGVGLGEGYSVNVPLPPGTYDEAYLAAFRAVALPIIGAYDPDVIVLELGMDCLAGDPLGHLNLTNNAYVEVIRQVRALGKPVLATGGGGYHEDNTARGWALAWIALCGEQEPLDEMSLGMGGVFLATTDWMGGLRDRALNPHAAVKARVDAELVRTIQKVRANVFRYHGL